MKTLLLCISLFLAPTFSYSQSSPLAKAERVKKLTQKIETLTRDHKSALQQNKKLTSELESLNTKLLLSSTSNASLRIELRNKKQEVETLKKELEEKNTQITNLIKNNTTLINTNTGLLNKVIELKDLREQTIIELSNTKSALSQAREALSINSSLPSSSSSSSSSSYRRSSRSRSSGSWMISGLAGFGSVKGPLEDNSYFSGDASVEKLLGRNRTIALGASAGANNYNGISSFNVALSTKFFFNESGLSDLDDQFVFIYLTARGGYGFINEKFEIIDNYSEEGIFTSGGVGGLLPINSSFAISLEINYKFQALKELAKTNEFVSNNRRSLNMQLGINIFL